MIDDEADTNSPRLMPYPSFRDGFCYGQRDVSVVQRVDELTTGRRQHAV